MRRINWWQGQRVTYQELKKDIKDLERAAGNMVSLLDRQYYYPVTGSVLPQSYTANYGFPTFSISPCANITMAFSAIPSGTTHYYLSGKIVISSAFDVIFKNGIIKRIPSGTWDNLILSADHQQFAKQSLANEFAYLTTGVPIASGTLTGNAVPCLFFKNDKTIPTEISAVSSMIDLCAGSGGVAYTIASTNASGVIITTNSNNVETYPFLLDDVASGKLLECIDVSWHMGPYWFGGVTCGIRFNNFVQTGPYYDPKSLDRVAMTLSSFQTQYELEDHTDAQLNNISYEWYSNTAPFWFGSSPGSAALLSGRNTTGSVGFVAGYSAGTTKLSAYCVDRSLSALQYVAAQLGLEHAAAPDQYGRTEIDVYSYIKFLREFLSGYPYTDYTSGLPDGTLIPALSSANMSAFTQMGTLTTGVYTPRPSGTYVAPVLSADFIGSTSAGRKDKSQSFHYKLTGTSAMLNEGQQRTTVGFQIRQGSYPKYWKNNMTFLGIASMFEMNGTWRNAGVLQSGEAAGSSTNLTPGLDMDATFYDNNEFTNYGLYWGTTASTPYQGMNIAKSRIADMVYYNPNAYDHAPIYCYNSATSSHVICGYIAAVAYGTHVDVLYHTCGDVTSANLNYRRLLFNQITGAFQSSAVNISQLYNFNTTGLISGQSFNSLTLAPMPEYLATGYIAKYHSHLCAANVVTATCINPPSIRFFTDTSLTYTDPLSSITNKLNDKPYTTKMRLTFATSSHMYTYVVPVSALLNHREGLSGYNLYSKYETRCHNEVFTEQTQIVSSLYIPVTGSVYGSSLIYIADNSKLYGEVFDPTGTATFNGIISNFMYKDIDSTAFSATTGSINYGLMIYNCNSSNIPTGSPVASGRAIYYTDTTAASHIMMRDRVNAAFNQTNVFGTISGNTHYIPLLYGNSYTTTAGRKFAVVIRSYLSAIAPAETLIRFHMCDKADVANSALSVAIISAAATTPTTMVTGSSAYTMNFEFVNTTPTTASLSTYENIYGLIQSASTGAKAITHWMPTPTNLQLGQSAIEGYLNRVYPNSAAMFNDLVSAYTDGFATHTRRINLGTWISSIPFNSAAPNSQYWLDVQMYAQSAVSATLTGFVKQIGVWDFNTLKYYPLNITFNDTNLGYVTQLTGALPMGPSTQWITQIEIMRNYDYVFFVCKKGRNSNYFVDTAYYKIPISSIVSAVSSIDCCNINLWSDS